MKTAIEITLVGIAGYCIAMHILGFIAAGRNYETDAPAMAVLLLAAAVALGFLGVML